MKKILATLAIIGYAVLLLLLLSGCSRKTPVDNAFHEVQTSIVQIKETLPPECKTVEVLAKIDEVEAKRQTAEAVCAAKIKDTQTKYERILWVIGFIVLGLFVKNFIKK